ncbi:MAG: glucuronate isomerase [Clostridia bacterium]|nr:glucuronate isomerase [Clostridia bacterium]
MDKDFLLSNKTARKLYHEYAEKMPIVDYHCHLSPQEIYEDKKYENITQVWLYGDHYKWRAMRSAGLDEKFMTGSASDREKFDAWAKVMPLCIGNPLYHWTHLELQRFFGINTPLNEKTADAIWKKTSEKLKNMSARKLIESSNVEVVCTTDDPADTLEYHIMLAKDASFKTRVLPTYRPDKAVNITAPDFALYIKKLAGAAGVEIKTVDDVIEALLKRVDFFAQVGGKISDHAFVYVPFEKATDEEIDAIFTRAMAGEAITEQEGDCYKTKIMLALGKKFHDLGWTMQLHIGAQRNNNSKMFEKLGPDTGFDSIADEKIAAKLALFLDALEKDGNLPKTILYTLNPVHNFVIGTMLGNFQSSEAPSKIQFGTAWWFVDHKDGMEEQMRHLASLGLLSKFVGMLTDSRSFLSYPRHEYFRRIMCNLIGKWVENGEYPEDWTALEEIVKGISYNNAKKYLGI